jgi:hypothetical protein
MNKCNIFSIRIISQKNFKTWSPMDEASPSGVAPTSPCGEHDKLQPSPRRAAPAPPHARHATCPEPPAHHGRGAQAARTAAHKLQPHQHAAQRHALMHIARHHEHHEHAAALRRVQHLTARPSRARAAQTRAPARGAARREQRPASPTPPACFPLPSTRPPLYSHIIPHAPSLVLLKPWRGVGCSGRGGFAPPLRCSRLRAM